MAENDMIYKDSAPALFGDGFCKKAKERDEQLKCLNQATSRQNLGAYKSTGSSPFFETAAPTKFRPVGAAIKGTQSRLPKGPSIQRTLDLETISQEEMNATVAKTTPLTYLAGTNLILVMSLLGKTKYLPNLMESQVITSLTQMGILCMVQSS